MPKKHHILLLSCSTQRQDKLFYQTKPLRPWCKSTIFFSTFFALYFCLSGVSLAQNLPLKPKERGSQKTKLPKNVFSRMSIGGLAGSWGGLPLLGIRGLLPLSPRLAFRLNWSLLFDLQQEDEFSFSALSFDLLIRLPTPNKTIRFYALTRLDFWPLWDLFSPNPKLAKISDKPIMGVSVLIALEYFLLPRVSYFLETGFSSGMVIGFSEIHQKYRGFGYVIQSGIHLYL